MDDEYIYLIKECHGPAESGPWSSWERNGYTLEPAWTIRRNCNDNCPENRRWERREYTLYRRVGIEEALDSDSPLSVVLDWMCERLGHFEPTDSFRVALQILVRRDRVYNWFERHVSKGDRKIVTHRMISGAGSVTHYFKIEEDGRAFGATRGNLLEAAERAIQKYKTKCT
jgi:hypothetical protein